MKLCYLADAQSSHTKKWVTFFANKGYEVHLISFREAEISNIIFHSIDKFFATRIRSEGSSFSKIGYFFYLNTFKNLIQDIAPDILHAHWATSYGLMGAYSGYHPYVLSAWGSDIFDFPHRSLLHKKVLEYVINKADFLTATSKALSRETQLYLKKDTPIYEIPFGVDLTHFKPKNRRGDERITIGIVKSLEEKYGLEYLIRAFAKLLEANPQLHLMIAGGGSEESSLKQLCRVLHIESRVRFLGFVEHENVPDILNVIDIFVVPSISESFGVAAVEAAACQLPVIASEIGGLPEVVIDSKTGFLVPPKNPDAIAEKIALLIENIELRKSMGEAARKFVEEHYNWEENAREMERLYIRAIEK